MEMEVTNGYALDDTVDSQTSQASTTSGSSLAIQFSVDELQENSAELPAPSSSETIRNEGKTRRLNRRLALANLQLPKLSVKEDSVIDLCTEEDRAEDLAWFKKKFPNSKADEAKAKHNGLTSPPKNPKNQQFPHSVATQRALKQDLEKKLAKRRKAEMAKRREQYMEDNEGLLEDEEEEVDTKDSIKPKKRVKKPVGSDDDSENDEDYNGDDEEEEEIDESGSESDAASGENDENGMEESADELDDSKVSKANDDLPESVDLFDGASTAGSANKDSDHHKDDSPCWVGKNEAEFKKPVCHTQEKEMSGRKLHPVESLNLMLNESFDMETPPISQPTFPNSLSQWFGDKPSDEGSGQETEEVLASEQKPEFVNIGSFSDMDPFKDTGVDDMLMLCSGRFDTQNLTRENTEAVGDHSEPKASDDEDEVHKNTTQLQKRKRKLVTSDDEDEANDADFETANQVKEKDDAEAATEGAKSAEEETESLTHLRRAIIDSDSDENGEEQEEVDEERNTVENGTVLEEEPNEDEEEEEMEEIEEEDGNELETEKKTKDYIEEEAEDSDDELAVIRRLERKEFERKANRENWFDDEASLSGDDVGSDVDEDGDVANEYEAEEGDADNLPDTEAIRRQNHRLLLKQEQEREHKALVKLQDRLLADGDLGGTETNRTFRLKLREEVTTVEGEEGETEVAEEEEASSSQAHAQRVSAIKWLIEHREEYEKMEDKDEDDIFDVATRSVKISEVTVNAVSKAPRTLLGQCGLENAIKEIAGTTTAKQLYMNNANAALKRPPSPSPAFNVAKKMRSSVSVLSVLEQQ